MASCNTVLQTIVEDDKRGRVMAMYTMAFMGTAPFGSLVAGFAAHSFGAPLTLVIAGAVCVAAAGMFLAQLPELRKAVRPIYVRKGIMPDASQGLSGAGASAGMGPADDRSRGGEPAT
jgi:MFS family permease